VFILAKVIQALGIADVGFALYAGMTQPHGMGTEYKFTGIGIVVFLVGYAVEVLWTRAGK
jgi:ABC-type Co2+ transport system permease subunit